MTEADEHEEEDESAGCSSDVERASFMLLRFFLRASIVGGGTGPRVEEADEEEDREGEAAATLAGSAALQQRHALHALHERAL